MAKDIEIDVNKLLYKLHEHAEQTAVERHADFAVENFGVELGKTYLGSGDYLLMAYLKDYQTKQRDLAARNSDLKKFKADALDVLRQYVTDFAGAAAGNHIGLKDLQEVYDSTKPQHKHVSESLNSGLEDMLFEDSYGDFDRTFLFEALKGSNLNDLSIAIGVLSGALPAALSSDDLSCGIEQPVLSSGPVLSVFAVSNSVDLWPGLSPNPYPGVSQLSDIKEIRSMFGAGSASSASMFISGVPGMSSFNVLSTISSLNSDQTRQMLADYIAAGCPASHSLLSVSDAGADKIGVACRAQMNSIVGNSVIGYSLVYGATVKDQKKHPLNRTVKDWFGRAGKQTWKFIGPTLKASLGFLKDAGSEIGDALFGSLWQDITSTTVHTGAGDYNVGNAISRIKKIGAAAINGIWTAAKGTAGAVKDFAGDIAPRISKADIGHWIQHVFDSDYPRCNIQDVREYTPQEVRTWLKRNGRSTVNIEEYLDDVYYVVGMIVPHNSDDYDIINEKLVEKIFKKACGLHYSNILKNAVVFKNEHVVKYKNLHGMYAQRDKYSEKIKNEVQKKCTIVTTRTNESIDTGVQTFIDMLFEAEGGDKPKGAAEQMEYLMRWFTQTDKKGDARKFMAFALKGMDASSCKLTNDIAKNPQAPLKPSEMFTPGSSKSVQSKNDFCDALMDCKTADHIRLLLNAYKNSSDGKKFGKLFDALYDAIGGAMEGIQQAKNSGDENEGYDTYFIFNKYVQDTTKSQSVSLGNDNTLERTGK